MIDILLGYCTTGQEIVKRIDALKIKLPEDPADEGYVMKYENGHMQWLPKDMFESDYKEYDESTLPATAIGMVSSDYKECFQAEYKQLRIRYEKLKRMRQ